jgi:hypothetical protein
MLNVDASYNQDRSTESTGTVIRDSNGHFIAAAARYFEHVLDVPWLRHWPSGKGWN